MKAYLHAIQYLPALSSFPCSMTRFLDAHSPLPRSAFFFIRRGYSDFDMPTDIRQVYQSFLQRIMQVGAFDGST